MTNGPRYRIEQGAVDDAVVVTVSGEIDMAAAPALRAALTSQTGRVVVADLSAVDFIDSTGLRSLLAAEEELGGSGERLRLVFGEGPVERLLELTGLGDRFETFDSVEPATEAAI